MRRVLFVDDEPQVLAGLRDSLRSRRREWKMAFALSGEAALEELAREPFDVVVSDMRMPGMDGATLLAKVQAAHPETVRIVLSGYAEVEVAVRAASVAHLFLAKPCDAQLLTSVVERACALQALLREEGARRVAAGTAALPSRPVVYEALQRALRDPEATPVDIAAIVEGDMAMSAKVLQLVNSAFFGLGRRTSSVADAVSYLGLRTIEAVVVSVAAAQAFPLPHPMDGFDIERLQRHGAVVGNIARRLAADSPHADDVYTAAMLHDIGLLVLAAQEPRELEATLLTCRESRRALHVVERERRGLTHAEVGAYLLGLWGVPQPIVEAVAHHHDPHRAPTDGLDVVMLVNVANQLAHECGSTAYAGVPAETVDEDAIEAVGALDRLPEWRRIAEEAVQGR